MVRSPARLNPKLDQGGLSYFWWLTLDLLGGGISLWPHIPHERCKISCTKVDQQIRHNLAAKVEILPTHQAKPSNWMDMHGMWGSPIPHRLLQVSARPNMSHHLSAWEEKYLIVLGDFSPPAQETFRRRLAGWPIARSGPACTRRSQGTIGSCSSKSGWAKMATAAART